MTPLLLAAILPGLFWEPGPEADVLKNASKDALRQAGIERVYGPGARELPAAAVKIPPPGVRYRADIATASTTPWVDANGWRYARGAGKVYFIDASKSSCALAAAEAFVYGADAVIKIDPKQLEAFGNMLKFLRPLERPPLPPLANIGVEDDGSALAGEAMNMLARKNLLFRIVRKPDPQLDLNVKPGADARNPGVYAQNVRTQLKDAKRLVRVYGSDVVLASFTGEGSRARLFLLNYGRGKIEGLRVRVLGKWGGVVIAGARIEDVERLPDAVEFSIPELETLGVIELERASPGTGRIGDRGGAGGKTAGGETAEGRTAAGQAGGGKTGGRESAGRQGGDGKSVDGKPVGGQTAAGNTARPDRSAAEWALRMGGSVTLREDSKRYTDWTELPASDFTLEAVNLIGVVVDPADFKRLSGLTSLRELYVSGRTWHSMPKNVSAKTLKLFEGLTSLEKFALSLPVQTEIPLEDDALANLAPLTGLSELRLAQTQVRGHTLAPFTKLTSLDLDHTRFDDAGMKHLEGMTGLTRLYARDTLVTDEGLKSLKNLHGLTELDLYGTNVSDAGVANLKGLIALRRLNLLGTSVTDEGLASLAGMKRLEELNLYRTKITNTGVETLTALPKLRELDVRYTSVTRRGVESVRARLPRCNVAFLDMLAGAESREAIGPADLKDAAKLASLTELDLTGAQIGDDDLARLAGLKNLERLSLKYTEITDAGLAHLRGLMNLKRLDLTGVDITDAGLAHLRPLTALRELLLGYGRFTDKGLAELAPLTNLTRLDLVRTRVTDGGVEAIAALRNLTKLNLDYTSVTDKGLKALASLTKLTELKLDSATVTDAGLDPLTGLAGLRLLNLYHTLVTDAGFRKLKAALPECKIVWDRESALPTRRGS